VPKLQKAGMLMSVPHQLEYRSAVWGAGSGNAMVWLSVGAALASLFALTFFFTLDWTFYENGIPDGDISDPGKVFVSAFLGIVSSPLTLGMIFLVRLCLAARRARDKSAEKN
jgi:hypothetical protein